MSVCKFGVSASILAAVLAAALSGGAHAAGYSVTVLTVPEGAAANAVSINGSGQSVGMFYVSGQAHAYQSDGVTGQEITTLSGYSPTYAYDINTNGDIAGATGGQAYVQAGGVTTLLKLPTSKGSQANSLNDIGQVVGSMVMSQKQGTTITHAFLYQNGGAKDLGSFSAYSSTANAVNNGGQVVGASNISQYTQRAFSWTPATGLVALATLTHTGVENSAAWAINDSGVVAGISDDVLAVGGATQRHAVLWQNGAIQDLGGLGGDAIAYGINDLGQAVGASWTPTGVRHAWVYSNGVMTDLNTLIPADSGWTLDTAYTINDNGQIVGFGSNGAFLLNPVP